MSSTPLAGIYGIAFQPYVGPWDAGGPVLFNTYTVNQVTQLLQAIAPHFSLIATYGQGTFVWQGKPNIQDSKGFVYANMYAYFDPNIAQNQYTLNGVQGKVAIAP